MTQKRPPFHLYVHTREGHMVTTDHPERFQSVEDALAYAQQRLQHAKLVELLWEGERAGTWAPT